MMTVVHSAVVKTNAIARDVPCCDPGLNQLPVRVLVTESFCARVIEKNSAQISRVSILSYLRDGLFSSVRTP